VLFQNSKTVFICILQLTKRPWLKRPATFCYIQHMLQCLFTSKHIYGRLRGLFI